MDSSKDPLDESPAERALRRRLRQEYNPPEYSFLEMEVSEQPTSRIHGGQGYPQEDDISRHHASAPSFWQPPSQQFSRPPRRRVPSLRLPPWLRLPSRLHLPPRRIVIPCISFVLGIVLGVGAILVYAFSISSDGRPLPIPPPPGSGDIVIQAGPAYLTQIVGRNLRSAGLPGQVKNVRVTLQHGDLLLVDGDDQFASILGIQITRHFTVSLQPYASACQLKMHVVRADMNGIPVTGFAETFEGKINKQLEVKPGGLPGGFAYCTIGARTETQGLFITYSAKPLAQREPLLTGA